jgi:cytochrome c oxidase subunit 2
MSAFLGLPPDASAHGWEMDLTLAFIHLLMAVLFIGWSAFMAYALVRFRQGKHPRADYGGAKSRAAYYLAAAVAVIEAVILIGFDIPFWTAKVSAFPAESDATVVRIVAQQFAWNVHYPGKDGVFGRTSLTYMNEATNPMGLDPTDAFGEDDITTINQLHLPVGKPVIVRLSSKDVIHSFFLPQMRVKQDIIPGMEIPVWFEPTQTGQWEIACAQLCGLGHYRMRGYYTIHDQAGFDQWMVERLAEKAADQGEEEEGQPVQDAEPAAQAAEAGA